MEDVIYRLQDVHHARTITAQMTNPEAELAVDERPLGA
jgi:hypothetical protein